MCYRAVGQQEMIHLSELDVLLIETTDITITTMLIKRLVDGNILVIFCDDKRLPSAQLMPYYGRHDSSLQLSKQIEWPIEKQGLVWTEIISQKILNQSEHLLQCERIEKSAALINLHNNLRVFDPSNREGHAARIYFNSLFGNDFTREQDSPINAGLDYGYTLLMSIFSREIVKCGCLTQLGLKHVNQFNDFNLASDLMEPFRPIVDQIVYANRYNEFPSIKRRLFDMFTNNYLYNNKKMFLSNIASDYTKKTIKCLNGELERVPEFRL